MGRLKGFDQYSGSSRQVKVDHQEAHVLLSVETSNGPGDVMMTPSQARALSAWLKDHADNADEYGSLDWTDDDTA